MDDEPPEFAMVVVRSDGSYEFEADDDDFMFDE